MKIDNCQQTGGETTLIQLKKIRKDYKVTLEELANYLEVNKSYLSRVENGIHPISVSLAISIADYFGISLDDLFGRKSNIKKIRKED